MTAIGLFIIVASVLALKLLELAGKVTDSKQLVLATVFSIGCLLVTGGVCQLVWEQLP